MQGWLGSPHQAANQLCKLCQAPRWGCGRAWHHHGGTELERGKAGLGQLSGVHQAPALECQLCPFPLVFLWPSAEGSSCLLLPLLWGGNAALSGWERPACGHSPSSNSCPVLLLSTDTARGISLCFLHHRKGQRFLVIQPASVTQPRPSSSISVPSS